MTLSELIRHLRPTAIEGSTDRPIAAVTHDSRLAGPADVFVAIRGGAADGRRFVPGLKVAAVVADGPVDAEAGVTVIQVPDAREALAWASAALNDFPSRTLPVVGITGTNGKTSITWMLEAMGTAAGVTSAVVGTTGHRVAGVAQRALHTTPEAPVLQALLARARDAGCAFAAMEVSSIGLIQRRADAIDFRVGVFTNLSRDHLDFHRTMEAYRDAKGRLFHELLAADGTAVLFADDPAAEAMRPAGMRTWIAGYGADCDIRATNQNCTLQGARAHLRTPAGTCDLALPLLGSHNLDNALLAVGAGLALGLPLDACRDGLAALTAIPGRLEPVPNDRGLHVLVDYAHTPDALRRVLSGLRDLGAERVLTVMGCGGDRDPGKRPLMGAAASDLSDHVYVTSDNPRSEDPQAIVDQVVEGVRGPHSADVDRRAAIHRAIADARTGDVVLIAGKGHEATQTIGALVLPFDDRLVAREVLS